jgi:hypothetical protein
VRLLLPLALLLAVPGSSEPLSDAVQREYLQPVLQQVEGALDGRGSNWTPPAIPGTAQTAKFSERVRLLWLEPLMAADQDYAFSAARSLASPESFEAPAGPDLASILPDASLSPAAEELVSTVERRFLSRLFPEVFAFAPNPESPSRFARPEDFAGTRRVADSTSLARGSGQASARVKLKAFHSSFSSTP